MAYNVIDPNIPESVNVSLGKISPEDDEAENFGNVFVIRTVSGYTAELNYSDGAKPETHVYKQKDAVREISLMLDNGNGEDKATYIIQALPGTESRAALRWQMQLKQKKHRLLAH